MPPEKSVFQIILSPFFFLFSEKWLFRLMVLTMCLVFLSLEGRAVAEVVILNSGREYEGEIFEHEKKYIVIRTRKGVEQETPIKMIYQIKKSTDMGVSNSHYVDVVSIKVEAINQRKSKEVRERNNQIKAERLSTQKNKLKTKVKRREI